MFENKMRALELSVSQHSATVSEMKVQLEDATEREETAQRAVRQMEDQVELLKNFPTEAKTSGGLTRELQTLRLTNDRLERERAELDQRLSEYRERFGTNSDHTSGPEGGEEEREERAQRAVRQMEDQVELLKNFPTEAKTSGGLTRELQTLRLTNDRLERERAELDQRLSEYRERFGTNSDHTSGPGYQELKALLKTSDREKRQLQADVMKMKKELENFDPTFFEDLKFNYNLDVKRNIVLEERLRKVCEQFGVAADLPTSVSIS